MNTFEYISINPYTHILLLDGDRETVNIEVLYTAGGSWYEHDGDRGKKHLLEHCIVARTQAMNHETFKDWERKHAIAINAYTSPQRMALVATGHTSDTTLMLQTLLECAYLPTFDQEDLEREKEIVLREISERRGDPQYQLYYDSTRALYVDGDFQTHETLGNPDEVAGTTIDDFIRLNKQSLDDGHMVITISGSLPSPDDITHTVQKMCSEYHASHVTTRQEIHYTPPSQMRSFRNKAFIHPHAHEHAELNIYIPCTVDIANLASRTVFYNLYLQYGGIIYDRLRDEKRLVYGLHSSYDRDTQTLQLFVTCEVTYIPSIVSEIEEILENFDRYFDEEKLHDYISVVYKKQAMANDDLQKSLSFSKSLFLMYNTMMTNTTFIESLRLVTVDDIRTLFTELHTNWKQRQVFIVSKQEEIASYNNDDAL